MRTSQGWKQRGTFQARRGCGGTLQQRRWEGSTEARPQGQEDFKSTLRAMGEHGGRMMAVHLRSLHQVSYGK